MCLHFFHPWEATLTIKEKTGKLRWDIVLERVVNKN